MHELDRPRSVGLSIPVWQAAAVLAGLRVAVNDPVRREDRDRGQHKNWLADIWGTIGELVALRGLNEITDLPVRHHPIEFEGSVDEVDFSLSTTDGALLLETKAHLLEPRKSWFMVNERARDRSIRRGAVGHLPVLSTLGGSRALIGRMILSEELEAWEAPDKPLADPAVGIKLVTLARQYFGQSLPQITATLTGEALIGRDELAGVAESAARDLSSWQTLLPALADRPAREVIDVVQTLLQARG